jgi:choline monooxygenase
MSDLTLPQQLSPQSQASQQSQLSVSSYFDEALFKLEQQTLFQNGPRYVGHRLAAPNPGDFYTLPQENGGRALIHGKAGIELVSNVCRHRQALILQGKGSIVANATGELGNLVCPLHNWTYDASGPNMGQLIAAPHFACDPALHLHNYKLQEWNGLLFEDNGRNVRLQV